MERTTGEIESIEVGVYQELQSVIDPEIGINIIDLGFVYKIAYTEEKGIFIEMTLSSKGCPVGDAILSDVRDTLGRKFPESKLDLQLVWEPSWSVDFVTPAGKEELGM